jgi:hypothetical protein
MPDMVPVVILKRRLRWRRVPVKVSIVLIVVALVVVVVIIRVIIRVIDVAHTLSQIRSHTLTPTNPSHLKIDDRHPDARQLLLRAVVRLPLQVVVQVQVRLLEELVQRKLRLLLHERLVRRVLLVRVLLLRVVLVSEFSVSE